LHESWDLVKDAAAPFQNAFGDMRKSVYVLYFTKGSEKSPGVRLGQRIAVNNAALGKGGLSFHQGNITLSQSRRNECKPI
jgi:hypothetical protein